MPHGSVRAPAPSSSSKSAGLSAWHALSLERNDRRAGRCVYAEWRYLPAAAAAAFGWAIRICHDTRRSMAVWWRGWPMRERSVICASMSQASARRRSCRAGAAPRPRAAKGPAAPAGAAWLIGLRDWDVRRGRTCPRDEMRRGAGGGASVALRSPALGLNQSSNGGLSSSCSSSLSSYQDGIRCGMTNTSARQSGGAIPSASITNSSNRGCISSSPSSSSTPSKPM
mmetsp:Transcript_27463/g.72568  ORF Transcript_27463/g.72568 Transcript_27463/m.72568 type:complete len:226 (-) Transcript_27463:98-775(-)